MFNKAIIKSFIVFVTVFICLMLTKAYSHIIPDQNTDLFIFNYLVHSWATRIVPPLFSLPISFLSGLLAYIMLEKTNRLSDANKKMSEINNLLETEIEEKNMARKNLEESEKRFREMAELLPSVICEVDLDLNVTYANELGLKMFEISKDELEKGFNGLCLIHPEELAVTSERIAKLIQGQLIDTIETKMCTKKGAVINVIRNTNTIRRDGKVTGLRLCITDISEQKAMQRELMHTSRMKSVAILAGGIAHKFNNLLNIITGHLELIQLENDENISVLKSIPPAFDAAKQMVKLTDLLLNYSRGGQLNLDSVDINILIEKLLTGFNNRLPDSPGIFFEHSPSAVHAEADKMQLQTVIQSVIQNSIEAAKKNGRISIRINKILSPADIHLRHPEADPEKKFIAIIIEDNGQGMDQITLNKLFDPFFSTKFPGRGLGMAAAYGIITAHGGWIDVTSSKNEGTCVTIYVPEKIQQSVQGLHQNSGLTRKKPVINIF